MAKLRIQTINGKTLVIDVGDADPAEYDSLATAAEQDYMAKTFPHGPLPEDVMNEPGLQDANLADIKDLGTMVKAGGAGIGNLAAGNTIQQAASDVEHVKAGETPETTSGKVGEMVGSQFTPAQIALQGATGAALEASGLGPWVTEKLSGWAGNAATAAVGKIKALAQSLGVKNLPELGQFLLSPVKIGEREFPAIVEATSSPAEMLAKAKAVQRAAGQQLGTVSSAVDKAVNESVNSSGMALNEPKVVIDLANLKDSVQTLKQEAVGDIPRLGKRVATQFDDALSDLDDFIAKQINGPTETTFSDLASIKTKIGNLVFKHGTPLESKAALNDVYHAISNTLDDAAQKVGGATGAAFEEANDIYHKLSAVVEGLEGRAIDAEKLFDSKAMLAALTAGLATHGPLAVATVPAAYGAVKLAENYGPQAIASGLNASAPFMSEALKAGIRSVPVIGNAISQGLGQ